jgi:hypothetical protein
LSDTSQAIKESNKLRLCGYCLKIKNRSKRFVSAYALTWHITHVHKEDMCIIQPVKIPQPEIMPREIID